MHITSIGLISVNLFKLHIKVHQTHKSYLHLTRRTLHYLVVSILQIRLSLSEACLELIFIKNSIQKY